MWRRRRSAVHESAEGLAPCRGAAALGEFWPHQALDRCDHLSSSEMQLVWLENRNTGFTTGFFKGLPRGILKEFSDCGCVGGGERNRIYPAIG